MIVLLGLLALGILCSALLHVDLFLCLGTAVVFYFALCVSQLFRMLWALARGIGSTADATWKIAAKEKRSLAKPRAYEIRNRILLAESYLTARGESNALAQFKAARRTGVSRRVLTERASRLLKNLLPRMVW